MARGHRATHRNGDPNMLSFDDDIVPYSQPRVAQPTPETLARGPAGGIR